MARAWRGCLDQPLTPGAGGSAVSGHLHRMHVACCVSANVPQSSLKSGDVAFSRIPAYAYMAK